MKYQLGNVWGFPWHVMFWENITKKNFQNNIFSFRWAGHEHVTVVCLLQFQSPSHKYVLVVFFFFFLFFLFSAGPVDLAGVKIKKRSYFGDRGIAEIIKKKVLKTLSLSLFAPRLKAKAQTDKVTEGKLCLNAALLGQEENLEWWSSTNQDGNQQLMHSSEIPPHSQNQHSPITELMCFLSLLRRGLRSVRGKRRWEREDVHFLFLNLCEVILGAQPPLSPDRCTTPTGEHQHCTPGLAMGDNSQPRIRSKATLLWLQICPELTTTAICLGINSTHILYEGI